MGILQGCEEGFGFSQSEFCTLPWDEIEKAVEEEWSPLPNIDSSRWNAYLLKNKLLIKDNPCISPDFCLDWASLSAKIATDLSFLKVYPESGFSTADGGEWRLAEDEETGDHLWLLQKDAPASASKGLEGAVPVSGEVSIQVDKAFPATFKNLIALKSLVLTYDEKATIFPTASGTLGEQSLGLGARFTALHYPATEWAMAQLNKSMVGNQNSIPRELIYDVNEALDDKLDKIPFPFIGCEIPEGHQGTSVEGMSHCSILSKVKNGFHKHQLPWGFNADHQPIGGKFDLREDELVRGCVFASYITFDISHEFLMNKIKLGDTSTYPNPEKNAAWVAAEIPAELVKAVANDCKEAGLVVDTTQFNVLLAYVWPAMKKMKVRDCKYKKARAAVFADPSGMGSKFYREMSIDELPGLTTQETLATILALCKRMDMEVQYVAPAFGFKKNIPYPDNNALRELISKAWVICKHFGVSIGFHSGSGKSAKNYQTCGEVTDNGKLEIKTSGRYTYEMGVALYQSVNESDQQLWSEWYKFTVDLAVNSAMMSGEDPASTQERNMAREFIVASFPKVMEAQQEFNELNETEPSDAAKAAAEAKLAQAKVDVESSGLFNSKEACEKEILAIPNGPSPDHMFWFEYNFLFVLATEGKADKSGLGSHKVEGFKQRARFYGGISEEGQLNFAKNVALYVISLACNTKLVAGDRCKAAIERLIAVQSYEEFKKQIAHVDEYTQAELSAAANKLATEGLLMP